MKKTITKEQLVYIVDHYYDGPDILWDSLPNPNFAVTAVIELSKERDNLSRLVMDHSETISQLVADAVEEEARGEDL